MQVKNTTSLMDGHMKGNISSLVFQWEVCNFKVSILSASSPALLLFLVPVLDLLVVPVLRHAMLHPTILKRLGVGAVWTLLSVLSALTLEGVGHKYQSDVREVCMFDRHALQGWNEMSSYWLFLPMVLTTVAEIFIYIPGM
jgi:hypothetical protein